jgi:hypothetical protein
MRSLPPLHLLSAVVLAHVVLLALPGSATPAAAQSLTIPEYRELLLSKQSVLERIDRELSAANARLDRLVNAEQASGNPRRERSRELSAEIVRVSRQVAELERQRRTAEADLSELRTALNERYSRIIEANLERLSSMRQGDPEYGPLLIETGRYVGARDSLRLQIRIQESVREFREFPILATDGPAEIREKAGFYRDYVNDVRQKIAAIDREIEQIRDREQVGRRMQELVEDLEFQGEDVPKRPTDASPGDPREDPALNGGAGSLELLAQPPAQRVAALEEEKRQLELLRRQFEDKVRDYDARARTIYNRQTSQAEEETR